MKKLVILAATLAMTVVSQAQASLIQIVTGADMVGVEVTVTFADNSQEKRIWDVISADASVSFLEGFSGGVFGSGWQLTQQGDSISEAPSGAPLPLGAWSFSYQGGLGIRSIYIDALVAGFVFDTAFGDASANGSGAGRPFLSSSPSVEGSFDQSVQDEVFGGLWLTGLQGGDLVVIDPSAQFADVSFQFLVDVDPSSIVSAPATLSLLTLAGLVGFSRRRQQGVK